MPDVNPDCSWTAEGRLAPSVTWVDVAVLDTRCVLRRSGRHRLLLAERRDLAHPTAVTVARVASAGDVTALRLEDGDRTHVVTLPTAGSAVEDPGGDVDDIEAGESATLRRCAGTLMLLQLGDREAPVVVRAWPKSRARAAWPALFEER